MFCDDCHLCKGTRKLHNLQPVAEHLAEAYQEAKTASNAVQSGLYAEPSLIQQSLYDTKRVPGAAAHTAKRQSTVDKRGEDLDF
jgi:hypothetical protein